MTYQIVRYQPQHRTQVLELQKYLWSPDLETNDHHLEWKYENNPYCRSRLIYLALHRGQVVAMKGFYGVRWQIGESKQILPALGTGDLVIAPEHRSRGLFARIMDFALAELKQEGYQYAFSLSTNRQSRLASLMKGWRSSGLVQTMQRVNRSWRQAGRVFLSPKSLPFSALDRHLSGASWKWRKFVTVSRRPCAQKMGQLAGSTSRNPRIQQIRDREYFSWRFQNPLAQYRFLFWKGSGLEGYLVLQSSLYGRQAVINVVDWGATCLRVQAELLEAAIRMGKFPRLVIWSSSFSDPEKDLLKDQGFEAVKVSPSVTSTSPRLLIQNFSGRSQPEWKFKNLDLLDLRNWDLRMIYSDGY